VNDNVLPGGGGWEDKVAVMNKNRGKYSSGKLLLQGRGITLLLLPVKETFYF
jgi:hypothetical protein